MCSYRAISKIRIFIFSWSKRRSTLNCIFHRCSSLVLILFTSEDFFRHVPHENCSLCSNWDQSFLIWWDLNLGNISRMANSLVIADSFIVVPEFNSLVLTTRNKVLTIFSNAESIDLSSLTSIKHSDSLSIKAIPVGNFSVASCSKDLRLIWMIKHLLEHGRLKETHHSGVVKDVPDDAWSIEWRRNGLSVLFVDFDIWNSSSVFFQGAFHDLSLSTDSPNANFSFHTSGDDFLAVGGSWNGCDTVVVSIVDGEEELAGLWEEGSDLTIVPTRKNAFSITGEENTVALEAWYFNSQELLSSLCVPYSDIIQTASCEELRIAQWERYIINSLVMASVSQLWADVISIAPVNCGLGCSAEEVSGVSSQRNGSNWSHNLCFLSHKHVFWPDFSKSAISRSQKKITVRKKPNAVDSLREKTLCWTDSLE